MYNFTKSYNRLVEEASKYQCLKTVGLDKSCDIIPMTTADMDFELAPEIKDAINEYLNSHVLGYSRETEDYLNTCIKYYEKNYNYYVNRESFITVPGIVSALSTSVATFTNPNDKVILFTPVYPPFYEVVEMQNREILSCALIDEEGYYKINFEHFERIAKDSKAKLILLCNPHNPSGRVWTYDELSKINEIAQKNNLIVVSDEIHSDIIFEPNKHTCYGTLEGASKNSIICHAASKTYNIAGLQCSNIIIENKELHDKFLNTNLSRGIERANVLGMIATKAAYQKAEAWKEEMKKVIKENFQLLHEFFKDRKEFILSKVDASFLAWLNFKNLGISHEEFMKEIYDAKFLAASGLDYGEDGRYYIRINVGLPTEKLKENLSRLDKKLKELK